MAFSGLFLSASFSPGIASHNSLSSLKARVAAVGTLQINEAESDTNDSDTPRDGATVYKTSCATCHTSGVANAPVLGNVDDWGKRIEQGIDTLVEHAIQGFSGSSGTMPAKGGNASLSDDAVTAAVQFMFDQVK